MFYLKKKVSNLKTKSIEKLNRDYRLGIVSGFIDAEGYVSKGNLVVSQKDKEIIDIIERVLKNFKIDTRKWWRENYKSTAGIWTLRISTAFKYTKHNSIKVSEAHTAHHSENFL